MWIGIAFKSVINVTTRVQLVDKSSGSGETSDKAVLDRFIGNGNT